MANRAVQEVRSPEEFQEAVRSGQPLLVEYFADWCGPCRALAPVVERVAAAYAGRLRVITVNVDAQPGLAEQARIREVPALHFFRDGRKVGALTGFRTDAALRRELARYSLLPAGPGAAVPGPEPAQRPAGPERETRVGRLLARLGRGRAAPPADLPPGGGTDRSPAPGREAASLRFIESEAELDAVFEASRTGAVLLFLHDPWCPVSARARRQVEELGGGTPVIDVSRQRHLNAVVERRTGVRHQSPQVIVLRDGAAVWHASHGRITAEAVRAALGGPAAEGAAS